MKTKVRFFMWVLAAVLAAPSAFAQYGVFDGLVDWDSRGSVKVPGEVTVEGEGADAVYELKGNGDDIWDNQDEGLFLYTELEGSWSIQARVEWIDPGTHEWSKIGVMVREDATDPASRHYWMDLRGNAMGDRVDTQWRDSTGGSSGNEQTFFPEGHELAGVPVDASVDGGIWLRVTRFAQSNSFTAEFSEDGVSWILAHTQTQDWESETAAFGLVITDHTDTEQLVHARVSNVQLTQRVFEIDTPIFTHHMDIYYSYDRLTIDGGAEYDPATGAYTVWGGGWDIWDADDAGHFLFTEVSGDFEFIATGAFDLDRTTSADGWIKMMLWARQDLTAGAVNYGSRVRRDGQFSWQKRPVANANGASQGADRVILGETGLVLEEWTMRVLREGDQFSLYYLEEFGEQAGEWVEVQSAWRADQVVPMEDPIFVGLGVTAHSIPDLLAYGVFTNVQLITSGQASVTDWSIH